MEVCLVDRGGISADCSKEQAPHCLNTACRCGDPKQVMSEEHNFTTPPAPGAQEWPQRMTVVADLGQTHNSSRTLQHVIASKPKV